MTDQVRDFVATYKPKPTPETFFGFLTVDYTEPKMIKIPSKSKQKPLYIKVDELLKMGYSRQEIADILFKTKNDIKSAISYKKNYKK